MTDVDQLSLAMALALAGLNYWVIFRRGVRYGQRGLPAFLARPCVRLGRVGDERDSVRQRTVESRQREMREAVVVGVFLGVPFLLALLVAIGSAFSSN